MGFGLFDLRDADHSVFLSNKQWRAIVDRLEDAGLLDAEESEGLSLHIMTRVPPDRARTFAKFLRAEGGGSAAVAAAIGFFERCEGFKAG